MFNKNRLFVFFFYICFDFLRVFFVDFLWVVECDLKKKFFLVMYVMEIMCVLIKNY